MSTTTTTLTLEDARRMIAAATKKAEAIKSPSNIAVVCAGGHLLAFERMANAWMGSIDISIKKAWTSRAFDIETKKLGKLSQSGAVRATRIRQSPRPARTRTNNEVLPGK